MDEEDGVVQHAVHDTARSMSMERNGKNVARESRGNNATASTNGQAASGQPSSGQSSNGQSKNVPAHTVRVGSIKVAVWKNSTQNGPMFNSTLVRSYKNQQGEWAETSSLSRDDLLVAAKALDLAHTFIVETEAAARAQQQEASE